ncbi:hypothetical protein NKH77_12850 [Streptomyces sp. M19]
MKQLAAAREPRTQVWHSARSARCRSPAPEAAESDAAAVAPNATAISAVAATRWYVRIRDLLGRTATAGATAAPQGDVTPVAGTGVRYGVPAREPGRGSVAG